MSSSYQNKISFETQNNKGHNKFTDEVELISANRKISNDTNTSEIIIPENDNVSKKNRISNNSLTTSSFTSSELVYGVSIDINNPRKIGAVNAFFYINNSPLIVIGPDCKYFNFMFYK